MKRIATLLMLGIVFPAVFLAYKPKDGGKSVPASQPYIVIAWNDLGMHCANQDFSNMCILPPYNTQRAQVIRRGSPAELPVVMTGASGVHLTYEVPGNTESASKTNFWTYAQQLFGTPIPANIGLAGAGMAGVMAPHLGQNYYMVEGIPITAFPDATPLVPDPYQLTLIKAWSATNELLASTQSVIPVAHEINCVSSGCHTSEMDILNEHDEVPGFNINNRPIFCANCHADNALGKPGVPGVPSFSQAVHEKHGGFIDSGTSADCYKCHPGPNTQCWRDVMHGSTGGITDCQDCHGSVEWVGHSIDEGREPWLEEPSCGAPACHGPNYAEEPGKLFRESKGHGGLFCSACHGSPHAIFPTGVAGDNVQNISLQGFSGTLSDCSVCHGYTPSGPGPHGITNNNVQNITVGASQTTCNGASGIVTVAGGGSSVLVEPGGNATFVAGYKVRFLPGLTSAVGSFLHGYISTNGQYCPSPMAPLAIMDPAESQVRTPALPFFTLYPNPVTGNFTIEVLDNSAPGKLALDIFGADGTGILTADMTGKTRREFRFESFAAGIYYVRMQNGLKTEVVKMVKY